MSTLFVVCAAMGGTVLAIQFVMSLVGLGGHAFDIDVSGDFGHDFGGDFHGDVGGDFHGDVGNDFHGDHSGEGTDAEHGTGHGATWLFGVLSFRTIVAALTFFGLAGLAAQSTEASLPVTLLVAIAAGATAMFSVYWLMECLRHLRTEGTVRVGLAIGQHGNVYLRVPGYRAGSGKIQLNLQNRTMEYLAITSGPELSTGTKVVVVDIIDPTTLEVQAQVL